MNLKKKIGLGLVFVAIVVAACMLYQHDDVKKDKEGILLVTFGSTYPAPQETYKNIGRSAKAQYSNIDIRWAYTSDFILKRLREGKGKGPLAGKKIDNDSPVEALEKMYKDGYTKIVVQSLHIIQGDEYDGLVADVKAFAKAHEDVLITVGTPLLYSQDDIIAVACILSYRFREEVAKGPVCFMGHGTTHAADERYLKLDAELKKFSPQFYVGTVEGIAFDANVTSMGAIIKNIKAKFPETEMVTITPLMSIAGDHTNNDMNATTGESDVAKQSWREQLMGAGYSVNPMMNGLGDYAEINAVWMLHLELGRMELAAIEKARNKKVEVKNYGL